MPRISEEVLARIKSEVSLKQLVLESGIALNRHGKDWVGHCPFHDDKTPSFVVSEVKNLWHCLGACGEGGDNLQFVMKHQGISFRHAVDQLQSRLNIAQVQQVAEQNVPSILSFLAAESEHSDQQVLNAVIDYYHERLLQSDAALAYLESRGLRDDDLIKRFKLGYADRRFRVSITVEEQCLR